MDQLRDHIPDVIVSTLFSTGALAEMNTTPAIDFMIHSTRLIASECVEGDRVRLERLLAHVMHMQVAVIRNAAVLSSDFKLRQD
jgi:hypothetical protein